MSPDRKSWRRDYFAKNEVLGQQLSGYGCILVLLVTFLAAALLNWLWPNRPKGDVVIYTSQDQEFAEPILDRFAKETGIEVRAVYDSEAVKTVGLANRMLAEAKRPRCDLWWSNEALRTAQLAQRGVFDTNFIREFGVRTRRIVFNTNGLPFASAPKSLVELTNTAWRGKVALAYPMFGTTSAHFAALRQRWGAANWETWCRALAANRPFLVDGNSAVVKLVGRGEALVGITDSDDIKAGEREGLPIAALAPTAESLRIPNTIAILQGAPHAASAARLFEYVSSAAVQKQLIAVSALEEASTPSSQGMTADWDSLARDLEPATETLRQIFLR
jgi:iron(III) transport system substrate-binding protein